MSAIWGAINFHDGEIASEVIEIFRNSYSKCAIDRMEQIIVNNIYFGCGIQYFVPEAKFEKLPNRIGNRYYTADVLLDNRKELLEKLDMEDSPMLPDGKIYQLTREKYGDMADNIMIGAYTSVSYDTSMGLIEIVADAVGYRFVHYMIEDGVFYFSSLIEPLAKIKKEKKANMKWLANFIGQDNLNMYLECNETPYDGIYRTEPAERIKICNAKIVREIYWNPFKDCKKVRYKDDSEYRKAFRDLYKECVTCMLRAEETSVYLSGGFDSTSVAVQAAIELEKKGKKLHAFTAVPISEFNETADKWLINDETELVKKTAEQYKNIECNFMELRDVNGWHDRIEYLPIAEQPYKSPQNLIWLYRGAQLSAEQGAKVILSGAFGNGTVSFENVREYLVWLFQRMKFVTLIKEISALGRKLNYTRKSILISTIKDTFGIGEEHLKREDVIPHSYVRLSWLEKFDTIDVVYRNSSELIKSRRNHRKYQKIFLDRVNFRHYSEFAQRNSIYTGVILRDPTRDKRLISFVIGLPYNQFTHNGVRRRLIREYMDDVMPEHIIKERRKGVQSADLKKRISLHEDQIKAEWIQSLEKYKNHPIIDTAKAIEELKSKEINEMTNFDIVRYIYTIIFLEFLEQFDEISK